MIVVLIGFTILFLLATTLPLLPVGWWWVRVLDYPRLQVAGGLLISLVCLLAFAQPFGPLLWGLTGATFAALVYQATWIWPFMPFASRHVADARGDVAPLRLLVANVRIGTRDAEPLVQLANAVEPDILLLVETDAWWDEALRCLADKYTTELRYPQENGYGLHFFTNLAVEEAKLRFLLEPEVPSIYARLRLADGEPFLFLGIHPQPPVPNFKHTAPRDAELLLAGREASDSGLPAVVAGDLNDVAWSPTTGLLMRTTGLLDPRRGRGVFATFPVQTPGLRWPLDHIFHTAHFTIRRLKICQDIGSDHFPVLVELCREETGPERQDSLDPENGDREEARQTRAEGKEKAVARDGTS